MKLYFIFFFILSSVKLFAQSSIQGKVVDNENKPMQYVTISLKKDSLLLLTLSTDSIGYYKFQNLSNGKYTLHYSYLNAIKQTVSIQLVNDTLLNIVLSSTSNILKEVNINGNKPIVQRKGDRFIFTPNKFMADGNSAIELLQHAPMVMFNAKSEEFSILNKKETVIYINNKKTTLPKEMVLEMLKSLPAENIKSIDIITNPGSEYEASITGGIININIKRQLYEGWLGNLSVTSQQSAYNTTVLNGAVNYRKGKIALQLIPTISNNYNYSTFNNLIDYQSGNNQNISNNFYRRYTVIGNGVNFDYDIDKKNNLSYKGWLSYVNGNSNVSSTSAFSKNILNGIDSLKGAPYNGKDTYLYNFGNINYHRVLDSAGEKFFDINIDYNQFKQQNNYVGEFNNLNTNGSIVTETGRYNNHLPQNFFNLSEKIEYSQPLNKSLKINYGIQNSNTRVNNNLVYNNFNSNTNTYDLNNLLTNNYSYLENYTAGYISLNKDFSTKVSASFALRLEGTNYKSTESNVIIATNNITIDTSYLNLFPSFSISYTANQQNQFGLSFSKKITRPGIELLFPGITYNSQNYFKENNPFLQPIIYYNGEVTYTLLSKYNFVFDYSVSDHAYSNFTIPVFINNIQNLKTTTLNYGTQHSFDFSFNANVSLIKDFWDSQITPTIDYSLYKSNIPQVKLSLNNFNYNFLFDNTIYFSKIKKWTGFVTFTYTSKVADISGSQINNTSHLDLGIKKVFNNYISLLFFANDIYKGNSIIKYYATPNALLTSNYFYQNNYTQSFTLVLRIKFGNSNLKQNREHKIANDELKNRTGN